MVFSSVTFLFFFLPICLGGYYLLGRRLRNAWLLLSSLVFYTWGGGALVSLLIISTVVDYAMGWVVVNGIRTGQRRPGAARSRRVRGRQPGLAQLLQVRQLLHRSDQLARVRQHRLGLGGATDRDLVLHVPVDVVHHRCFPGSGRASPQSARLRPLRHACSRNWWRDRSSASTRSPTSSTAGSSASRTSPSVPPASPTASPRRC